MASNLSDIKDLLGDVIQLIEMIEKQLHQEVIDTAEITELYQKKGLLFEELNTLMEKVDPDQSDAELLKTIIDLYREVDNKDNETQKLLNSRVDLLSSHLRANQKETQTNDAYEAAGQKQDTSLFIRSKLEG